MIADGGAIGEHRDKRRTSTTVRINVHLTADGSTAVGIVRSEWQGATRVDYRVKGLERKKLPPTPEGVWPELWAALCTLDAMCKQQHAKARNPAAG